MLEILKEKNKDIELFSVNSEEFKTFGRIINIDAEEIIKAAEKIENPAEGSSYVPSEEDFKALNISEEIKKEYFGTLPSQMGYCWGHNTMMNATEWHTSSEINIAVTPLVLILGHVWDIENGKIDSSAFKAFYLPKGTAVEVYSTSLHFCPCQVNDNGFGCVVGLPEGTNTPLETEVKDKMLFRKNKWIISHVENTALIEKGVVAGITGKNFEIKY